MVECDDCNEDVATVWRHRRYTDSMTHREIEWVCEDCHPTIPQQTTAGPTGKQPVADGGRPTTGCPICSGPTVNGQGLYSCTDCGWSGPR
jgi:rubrerythrin